MLNAPPVGRQRARGTQPGSPEQRTVDGDRCVMTTRPQPGGIERDLDVLRTINAERQTWLGVGALVVAPGKVAVGDELTVVG